MNIRHFSFVFLVVFLSAMVLYLVIMPMAFPSLTTRIGFFSSQILTAWIHERDQDHTDSIYRQALQCRCIDDWRSSIRIRYKNSRVFIRYELQTIAMNDEVVMGDLAKINGGRLVYPNEAFWDRESMNANR